MCKLNKQNPPQTNKKINEIVENLLVTISGVFICEGTRIANTTCSW